MVQVKQLYKEGSHHPSIDFSIQMNNMGGLNKVLSYGMNIQLDDCHFN